MAKNRIILSYRINDVEMIQVHIDAASAYPDALDQTRTTARAAMRDLLADVIEINRVEPAPVEDTEQS